MAVASEIRSPIRLRSLVVVEFAVVTLLLIGLYAWRQLLSETLSAVFGSPPWLGGILLDGLLSGGLFIAGLGIFTLVYATSRDIDTGHLRPPRPDWALFGLAGSAPVVLVGLTKLVGVLTGVPYNSLTKTAYAADPAVMPVVLIAGLGVTVQVLTLLLVCQVLVQGSFVRVVGADTAIVLTTIVAGFGMMSSTGGLVTVPDTGKLVGAVLFVMALGVAAYATDNVARSWLRYLAYGPVLLLGALFVLSGIAEIGSIAAGLFVVTHLTVLGLAAFTYDRTASLLGPAVAYTSLLVANVLIVFVLEAGLQSW